MERIGIAASKIAKGNIFLYNLYVIMLSFLCCFMLFVIAGTTILLSLIVLGYILNGMLPQDYSQDWQFVIRLCMVSLSAVVTILNIYAIVRNFRFKRS